jgi:hypothetical protein
MKSSGDYVSSTNKIIGFVYFKIDFTEENVYYQYLYIMLTMITLLIYSKSKI